jgi:hypothetical protein
MHAVAGSVEPTAVLGRGAPAVEARRSSASTRELLLSASALALLALVMCAGHVHAGGLYYDDWSLLAAARFPPPGGVLHDLWLNYGQRPGQVLYYAALDGAIGVDAPARLALSAGALVLEVTCLYALLRQLGLAARHAIAIAALVLVFPFSDSVWLWGVLSLGSIAIAAFLLGLMLALRALHSEGRRRLVLHGASLALYVGSVASYEITAVAACLSGLLYVRDVGVRRARARWALDVLAVALTLLAARVLLPIDIATPSRMQSLSGMVSHAGLIAARGVRLIGAAALPVRGLDPWLGVGALCAVLAAALSLRRVLVVSDPLRGELGRWLAIAGAGALVAVAGWAVYVPATDHYAPGPAGTINRINAAAAIGIAILLYALVMMLVRMLLRLARLPSPALSAGAAAVVTLALLGAYVGRSAGDARTWDSAARDQRLELSQVHAALPSPLPGATVYVLGAPAAVGPGIPVLGTTLDLTSALRISYSSARLNGVPLAGRAILACGPRGPLAAGVTGAYGDSYLLDVRRGLAVRLTVRQQCAARLRGPLTATRRPGPV